jgi:hypothetical protein
MQQYIFRTLSLFCILSLSCSAFAQEFLTGLKTNPQILKIEKQKGLQKSGKSVNTPLFLPFFEDFSNYTGYPNQELFIDKQAFVNTTFPVFSPTIGVVTLDALNEFGEIYPHLNSSPKGADTLTSRYIRLDSLLVADMLEKISPDDSVYFSFYFQPGGGTIVGKDTALIGNQPNTNDSLVLEFGYFNEADSTTIWEHIWSTPGFNLKEWTDKNPLQYFKQVMIPITKSDYFCEKFQFRFRNYASLEPQQGIEGWEGNVDQWHIDYIRLDVDRNINDTCTNDLAFAIPTTSMLEKYQEMPWKQFLPADLKKNFTNYLTNLSDGARTANYQYTVTQNGNIVSEYRLTGNPDVKPYFIGGFSTDDRIAFPEIKSNHFSMLSDTAIFKIEHIFQNVAGTDFCLFNDTCVFEQKFDNYYAYDDGTAEYGYCLNNQYGMAFLAMKFPLRIPDSLSAVRMWFNHTKNGENLSSEFNILVWSDDNGMPGAQLDKLEGQKPRFDTIQPLNFAEYRFDEKIFVSGDIWVGFEQYGNVQLNIGFDQNTDSREFFRYNTNGNWEKSAFKGTPMLRPVFGKLSNVSIKELPISKTIIAPNPATDFISITNYELRITSVEIFDLLGRKHEGAKARRHEGEVVMDISSLSAGFYFVRIYKENNTVETVKFIKN